MAEMREELNQIKIKTTKEDDSCAGGPWDEWREVKSKWNGNDEARGSRW